MASGNRLQLANYLLGQGTFGRNYVINPSGFKNVTQGLAIAGSVSASRNTSAPLTAISDIQIAATGVGTAIFSTDTLDNSLSGQTCELTFDYKLATAASSVQIIQNSVTIQLLALPVSSSSQAVSLIVPCGSLAGATTIGFAFTATSTLNVANLYYGAAKNIGSAAQAVALVSANRAASNQTGVNPNNSNVKIAFNSVASPGYDPTSAFSTANNRFSAATAGNYAISVGVGFVSTNVLASRYLVFLQKNGSSEICRGTDQNAVASQNLGLTLNCTVALAANDYIEVFIYGSGNNSASTLTVDGAANVTFFNVNRFPSASEQVFRVGAPGQQWTSFTPTGSWVTNTTYTGQYQCQNGNLALQYNWATSGAPTSTALLLNLPASFTIDTTKLVGTAANGPILGSTVRMLDAAINIFEGRATYETTTSVRIKTMTVTGSNTASAGDVTQTAPFTWGASDTGAAYFVVPVTADSPCPAVSMPLIKNAVTTPSNGVEKIVRVEFGGGGFISCGASPCTVTRQTGTAVTSVVRNSVGSYTINFAVGTFSGPMTCTAIAKTIGVNDPWALPSDTQQTSTTFNLLTKIPAGFIDSYVNMICMGPA